MGKYGHSVTDMGMCFERLKAILDIVFVRALENSAEHPQ